MYSLRLCHCLDVELRGHDAHGCGKAVGHARGKGLHVPCIEAAHLGSVSMLKLLSVTSVKDIVCADFHI